MIIWLEKKSATYILAEANIALAQEKNKTEDVDYIKELLRHKSVAENLMFKVCFQCLSNLNSEAHA